MEVCGDCDYWMQTRNCPKEFPQISGKYKSINVFSTCALFTNQRVREAEEQERIEKKDW